MSRNFASASSQYMEASSAVATTHPLTISSWYKPTNHAANQTVGGCFDTTAQSRFSVEFRTGQIFRANYNAGGSGQIATGTATVSDGVWAHVCAVFASTTSRSIYTNGADKQTNANSLSENNIHNVTTIGAAHPSTGVAVFANADIAEFAMWIVALTDDEVLSLAKGVSPLRIRPQSLRLYVPCGLGSPDPDYTAGQRAMTLSASPAVGTTNPPVMPDFAWGLGWRGQFTAVAAGHRFILSPS